MREYPTYSYVCRVCHVPLRLGHNFTPSQVRQNDYSCRECRRDYVRSRPDETLLIMVRGRAKRHGIPFELSLDDIRIPARCPILGIPLQHREGSGPSPTSPTIDRLKPELGYVPGNVRVISHRANTIKGDRDAKQAWVYASAKPGHIDRLKVAVWLSYGVEQ